MAGNVRFCNCMLNDCPAWKKRRPDSIELSGARTIAFTVFFMVLLKGITAALSL